MVKENVIKYDVALSFADEDRLYVEKVANSLIEKGIKVFYDKYEQVTLWGKNLYDHLSEVYEKKARFTVMFISANYASKLWTNHERQSAQSRAFRESSEYILPVRFDDTEIPGLLKTIGYISLEDISPQKLCNLICQKLISVGIEIDNITETMTTSNIIPEIEKKIDLKQLYIGIIGLGSQGLPIAIEYAKNGYITTGLDIDSVKVSFINRGKSYIQEITDNDVLSVVKDGNLTASNDFKLIQKLDVLFVCVPTPLDKHNSPDLSYILNAFEIISKYLRKGHIIILRSMSFPGTLESIAHPILQAGAIKNDLNIGRDYFLAYCPERLEPGIKTYNIKNIYNLVGGLTPSCTELSKKIIQTIMDNVFVVKNPKVAEMSILLENIFQSVNYALINEFAKVCNQTKGISIWEVIEAAATKPYGYMPFYPSARLQTEPYYFSWFAREYNIETSLTLLAARINEEFCDHIVNAVIQSIAALPISISQSRILVLGITAKKNIAELRNSYALQIINMLFDHGFINIDYNDPYIPALPSLSREIKESQKSVKLTVSQLRKYDVVLLLVAHDSYQYSLIAEESQILIDATNTFKNYPDIQNKLIRVPN